MDNKDIKAEVRGLFDDVEDTSSLNDEDVIKRLEDYLESIDPDAIEQNGVLMSPDDIITLKDEQGNELNFTEVAQMTMQGKTYALLQSIDGATPEDILNGNCDVYVFEVTRDDDGENSYTSVEDDDLLDEIVQNYEAMVADYYNSQDDE